MPDLVTTVFHFSNTRFHPVPAIEFDYREKPSNIQWRITAGGSRGYTVRFGPDISVPTPENVEAQNADSYFMIQRVESALLLAGHGLFKAHAVGRMLIKSVMYTNETDIALQYDFPAGLMPKASHDFYDWARALHNYTILRRAAGDAHAALMNTHEANVFVYRGLEWLVVGEGRSWNQLAQDMGVSKNDMKDWKQLINIQHAGRHASRSGTKLRADGLSAASLVAGLY